MRDFLTHPAGHPLPPTCAHPLLQLAGLPRVWELGAVPRHAQLCVGFCLRNGLRGPDLHWLAPAVRVMVTADTPGSHPQGVSRASSPFWLLSPELTASLGSDCPVCTSSVPRATSPCALTHPALCPLPASAPRAHLHLRCLWTWRGSTGHLGEAASWGGGLPVMMEVLGWCHPHGHECVGASDT